MTVGVFSPRLSVRPVLLQFADDANRERLEAMQAVQQARAQAEWLISAANVAQGESRAAQSQSRTQKQLIEALIAEVKGVRWSRRVLGVWARVAQFASAPC